MKYLMLCIFSLLLTTSYAQERTSPKKQYEELGLVSWYRNYDEAVTASKKMDKPILLLFQEVPGCSTCKNYGNDVLSHPLMVESIEDLFIPLVIYNNKGGEDERILKKFNEPSWNNPVVRIIDADGKNLISRVSGNYTVKGLHIAMQTVLIKKSIEIPAYFELLGNEINSLNNIAIKTKYFKMFCFWSGEGHLGNKDGVLTTEAGFMGGHEVVKVTYDVNTISETELVKYAKEANCEPVAKSKGYRLDKDQQYYLKQTNYKYIPLTKMQRTKINSALAHRTLPLIYLSPLQKEWLSKLDEYNPKLEVLYSLNFKRAWNKIKKHLNQ